MIAAPTLTVRIACPLIEPILLGQRITFRQLGGPNDGYTFAGTVAAISRVPALPAVDIVLESAA